MIRNFDIDALRTMVVGVELGSFSRAASELGRSQSAISMHIKKLEERAGKSLFVRSGRGLVPTEAGEQLLSYARKIISLNDEAAVALGVGEVETSIKLGIPQDFFEVILPRTIEAFSDKFENVHVDVRAGRNHTLEEAVFSGRIDVAISFFPTGSKGHGELLTRLQTRWIGSDSVTSEFLEQQKLPLVLFDHPCLFRTNVLKALERDQRLWRVALTTPSLSGVWSAVAANQGITSRTLYRVPPGLKVLPPDCGLPETDPIEVRMLVSDWASPSSLELCEYLRRITHDELAIFSTNAVET